VNIITEPVEGDVLTIASSEEQEEEKEMVIMVVRLKIGVKNLFDDSGGSSSGSSGDDGGGGDGGAGSGDAGAKEAPGAKSSSFSSIGLSTLLGGASGVRARLWSDDSSTSSLAEREGSFKFQGSEQRSTLRL
jgi:hypothetical protein